jgi:hypothetical protein
MADYQEYIFYPSLAIKLLQSANTGLEAQYNKLICMRELTVSGLAAATQDEKNIYGTMFYDCLCDLDEIVNTTTYKNDELFASIDYENKINTYIRKAGQGIDVWGDDSNNIFGANDNAATHHINVKYGLHDDPADAAAFNNGTSLQAFAPGAPNYITIQFGKIDNNGIFKKTQIGIDFKGLYLTGAGGTINAFDNPESPAQIAIWGADSDSKIRTLQELIDNDTISSGSTSFIWDGTNITGLQRIQDHLDYTNTMLTFLNVANNALLNNTELPRARRRKHKFNANGGGTPEISESMQQLYREYYGL